MGGIVLLLQILNKRQQTEITGANRNNYAKVPVILCSNKKRKCSALTGLLNK